MGRGIVLHESPMVVSSIPPACSWQELLEQNVSILKCTNSLGLSPSPCKLTSVETGSSHKDQLCVSSSTDACIGMHLLLVPSCVRDRHTRSITPLLALQSITSRLISPNL